MTQEELEKEIARLKIKLETLVDFLESFPGRPRWPIRSR